MPIRKLTLLRIEKGDDGVFGVLLVDKKALCLTLEEKDQNNEPHISCIPEGEYVCVKVQSPRFGETFLVTGENMVRSSILFHTGNTIADTHGCILLGSSFGVINGQRGVVGSGIAFKEFLFYMKDEQLFELSIKHYLL